MPPRSTPAGAGGHRRSRPNTGLALAGIALAAGGAFALMRAQRERPYGASDSAPGRTARGRARFGDYAVVGRTVTINRPRAELYAFWRDFRNLATFMDNVETVEPGPEADRWVIRAPLGRTVDLVTRVVKDEENAVIAWRATAGSDIDAEGRVTFRDAPGGRGTQVEALIAYVPPAGELGRVVAKLFQREPAIQGRRELKRLKMLMETGEIATSRNRRDAA
jgi:uncharacterized membrane protein